MVRLHANRQTLVVALLLLGSVLASFRAVGDPAIIDNRNGTKTALWDFSQSANYTGSNISVSRNDTRLGSTWGRWAQSSDVDFVGNGSADAAVEIVSDSLKLRGD